MSRVVGPALIVALLSSPSAAQPAGGRDDEREIRAIEEALAQALHARSRSHWNRCGRRPLCSEARQTSIVTRGFATPLICAWGDRSDMRNFQARSLNGAAVATFELTFSVDPTTCRPSVLRSLITDVWVRQAARWQLQIRHSGAPRRD